MQLHTIVTKLFSTEYMVKSADRLGDLPKNREAYGAFVRLAWPAMVESMFVALAGFIDTVMVSRASDTAIAAVGITTQPRMLFYMPFFALSAATVAIVSRRYGEERKDAADHSTAQSFSLAALFSVIEVLIAFLVAKPLLLFAGAKTDTLPEALVYFKITIIGLMFYSFGVVLNAAQRGTGRTKITMRSSLTGNIINIILNYFLIGGVWIFPRLGVTGAAIATLIGHFCSFLISVCSFWTKNSYLRLRARHLFRFDRETLSGFWKVGSGAGMEQLLMRIGMFAFAKVVADLGTDAMTTHQICMNIINLSFACGDGLGAAAAAMVGQNLGRGRPDISLLYGKVAQRIAWGFSAVLFVLFSQFGRELMGLFADREDIIAEGTRILIVVAFVSLSQVSQVIFTGSLRGAGDTRFNAVLSLVSMVAVRPILAYLLCHVFRVGVIGAWFALLVDQYTRFFGTMIHFYRGKWKNIKL